jgi:hypothetical protein
VMWVSTSMTQSWIRGLVLMEAPRWREGSGPSRLRGVERARTYLINLPSP